MTTDTTPHRVTNVPLAEFDAHMIDAARDAVIDAQRAADRLLLVSSGSDRADRLRRARIRRARAEAEFDRVLYRAGFGS